MIVLALAVGIVLHEVAHAWAAKRLGDPTAAIMGRCSLLPWRHVDALGSILLPALAYFALGAVAGWGKPVPLDRLRLGRRGYVLALAAGPAVNLLLAALCWPIGLEAAAGVNLCLAGVNLLPVPGLDGGRIASELGG